ncbi:C40 family peptidase [Mangrovibacterium marinum]|uniref:SH3 domain-containing protein n=1 Tax=Mangrovibacterium marinum TaxID=1639118 RepID=A0A2T5BY79_9BACT|nr:C40 family peptidase [Mangrovibacterium marinum]PTN06788.1 SH3 domain-containing protein [Mangrovibacterium marinum]
MNYGISGLSIIPVRKEPSERSEMVTQILFGEHFSVHEQMMGWCRIVLAYDGYEGWVDLKMITPLAERTFEKIEKAPVAVCIDIFNLIPVDDEQNIMIVAGSSLPCWRPYKHEFSIGRETFKMTGKFSYHQPAELRKFMIRQALMYFNAPYLWGGRSPFGIDCSGYSQIIYKMVGIKLPRDAKDQVHLGEALTFVEEAQPGDLAFFDNDEGHIVHVGIIWEKNKIIHASGKVRIDNVDQFGIFNVDTKQYSHKMRVMKRILP